MPSLDLIASFVSAARHRSFAGAARELGVSPSAIAKNVARLESHLGVRLFHRTTRRVALSTDGEALLDRCVEILEDVEALEAEAAGARAEIRGTLRIDMPSTYGRQVILPAIMKLAAQHPRLAIDGRFSDHVVDIIEEGLDAAVRIGPVADSRLVARRFDEQTLYTCAGPGYLAAHGEPASPDDLHRHACLLFRLPSSGRDRPWQFRSGRRDLSTSPDGVLRLGDGEALVRAATGDLGIVQVPHYMAEHEIERGRLVEILSRYRPPPVPISLVYPSRRHVPLRVRAVVELLTAAEHIRG